MFLKRALILHFVIVPAVSLKFLSKERLEENYECHSVKYEEVLLKDRKPFSWEISSNNKNENLLGKKLPTKLYNVKSQEVEEIEEGTKIENYAIVSYVCGKKEPGSKLSLGAEKVLKKAEEACYYLGIDYLWIDQLCINQDDPQEKAEEIKKMHQYYSRAAVTLVSINTNAEEKNTKEDFKTFSLLSVLELVLRSKWFTRSWCYQEGWLSKQTIFMFDDCLVDGRALAGIWVLQQPSYSDGIKYNSVSEFNEGSRKIATPLGWVYYKDGYNDDDKMFLTLNEALRAIKDRKRTLPIDGVYSILGLLPYGEKVKVDYNLAPEQALLEVMKTAAENGYAEPLAWHGKAENGCLIPDMDRKGSTNVRGSLHIKCDKRKKDINFESLDGKEIIRITGSVYNIENPEKNAISFDIEENFAIDGGAYMKNVAVSYLDENKKKYVERKITLLGARETLDEMKINDELVVFNKEKWRGSKPFGILLRREGDHHRRIGLVEFQKGTEKELTSEKKEEELIILTNDRRHVNKVKGTYNSVSREDKSKNYELVKERGEKERMKCETEIPPKSNR